MKDPAETARAYLLTELRFPEEELDEILALGRQALSRALGGLVSAVAGKDAGLVSERAHIVKGILRNMGLDGPAAIARRMETLIEAGSLADVRAALDALCAVLGDFARPAPADPGEDGFGMIVDNASIKA
ncbi:Hpt domain-containing protein [Desulfolutivibrio sulfoxidireducens]|uniref:Hpt domain-containing protein n=1 Tax=Desulfolutivibrio sulfoxidireducens TaxID=2773299 RepID=UPI00159E885C|nr:Hpt domain-containing protein [Desulfolutivibrio sulfoxidireducens]QLA17790.1 hypothetical protein GD605_17750 [Desulfolutivibrio sulfoxidireducens]QLA21368.1 hypothetical protein GD604_17370 [Desulfolutivibrio sulfoxidireducens]